MPGQPVVLPGGLDQFTENFMKSFLAARGLAQNAERIALEKDRVQLDRDKHKLDVAKARVAIVGGVLPEGTPYTEMVETFPWLKDDVEFIFGPGSSDQLGSLPVRARTVAGQAEALGLEWLTGQGPEGVARLGEAKVVGEITGGKATSLAGINLEDLKADVATRGFTALLDDPRLAQIAVNSARKELGLDEEMTLTDPETGQVLGTFDTIAAANLQSNWITWHKQLAENRMDEAAKTFDGLVSDTVAQLNKLELTVSPDMVKNMYLWNNQTVVGADGEEYNALDMYAAKNWQDPGVRTVYNLIKGQLIPTAQGVLQLGARTGTPEQQALQAVLSVGKEYGSLVGQDERLDFSRRVTNILYPGLGDAAVSPGWKVPILGALFGVTVGEGLRQTPQVSAGPLGQALGVYGPDAGPTMGMGAIGAPPLGPGAIGTPVPEGGAAITPQGFMSLPPDAQLQAMSSLLAQSKVTPAQLAERGFDPKLVQQAVDASRQGAPATGAPAGPGLGPISIRSRGGPAGLLHLTGAMGRRAFDASRALALELAKWLGPVEVSIERGAPSSGPAEAQGAPIPPPPIPPSPGANAGWTPTTEVEKRRLRLGQAAMNRKSLPQEIAKVRQSYGVTDPDLAWLIAVESSGRPTSKNPKSTAFGLGQMITAQRVKYGKKLGINPNTTDPREQIRMMEAYIQEHPKYGTPTAARRHFETRGWY